MLSAMKGIIVALLMTCVAQADTTVTAPGGALEQALERFVAAQSHVRADGSSEVWFTWCDSAPNVGEEVEIWSTLHALGRFRVKRVERLPLCDGTAHRFHMSVPGAVRGPLLVRVPGPTQRDWPMPKTSFREPAPFIAADEQTVTGRVRLEVYSFDVDGDGRPDAVIRADRHGHPFSLHLVDRLRGRWVESFANSLS